MHMPDPHPGINRRAQINIFSHRIRPFANTVPHNAATSATRISLRMRLQATALLVAVVVGRAKRSIVIVISRFMVLFCRIFLARMSVPCALLLFLMARAVAAAETVNFNRDARKILSDNCFKCHGPDEKERKGGKKGARLRLDTPEGAQMDLGGHQAIVPGHPEKSEMVKRITSSD